jgi:hypothetical protein
MPPNMVYNTTPTGSRKHAAAVGMPVSFGISMASYHISRSTCRSHNSGASRQQHGSNKNIGKETKHHEYNVRDSAVSCSDDLQKRVRIRGSSLQLDGNRSKEDDLYSGPRGVPERARNTVSIGDSARLEKSCRPGPGRYYG